MKYNLYPIFVICLCALFPFYKYILQIYPSIISDQLMAEFQLTGTGLGNLAATFYYADVVSQFFVGVMLDKYSTRWVTSAAIFSCALGVSLFSLTHSLLTAGLARGLIGAGVAFAPVAYMKLAAVWFQSKHYAFINGLLATAAMAGALFGEAPLTWLVNSLGWRQCLCAIGFAGFVLMLIFALTVRDAPSTWPKVSPGEKSLASLKDLVQLIKNKQNWLLTCYGGLAFSPLAVFGGLWGNPFLQQAYHLSKAQAASMISFVFLGLAIGSPLLGIFSDRFRKRRHVMLFGTLLSCVAISFVLYGGFLSQWILSVLLFAFGFGLGAYMLVFAVGKEMNSIHLTATVIAMINASDAILDAMTEPCVGKLLDLSWGGEMVNGMRYFSLHSYHVALMVLPMYLLIASGLLLWMKDGEYCSEV